MSRYYFAYGSNMNPARMQARGLRFDQAELGRLSGYALCFNKRAHDRDGYAYANVRHARGEVVQGVLYRLCDGHEISKMDPFEGTPVFYSREVMPIETAAGIQPSWVYFANPAMRAEGLLPAHGYMQHLLAGKPFLSDDYWAALAALPTQPD
ncbi:gamma-glutamylcyclotransferase family protein [Atopomonas sediminilitoris]|uniref:gamma-glutamylcyclotransferase family protein n=1 Tax=Atopomonas sediminilitoris TaxID=2919919 RepID=UPI001F4DC41B|nr:gamma-glutamylcyclotransferase [Atopomonas sediminilitoris]